MSTELAEVDQASPGPTGAGIMAVLWRRKAYLIFGAVVGVGLGYLDYLRRDRVYQSTAQVYVQKRRIDPIQQPGVINGIAGDARVAFIDDFLATQEALIRSSVVLSEAGAELQKVQLEKEPTGGDYASYIGSGLSVSRVQTGSGTSANILNISCRGPSSPDCAAAVNAVIAAYITTIDGGVETVTENELKQIRANIALIHGDMEAKDKEFTKAHDDVLNKSTMTLAELRVHSGQLEQQKFRWEARREEIKKLLVKVREWRSQQLDARSILNLLQAYKDVARDRTPDAPVRPPDSRPNPEPVTRPIDEQIAALKREEKKLLTTFGKDHPEVVAVREQINELNEQARQTLGPKRMPGMDAADQDLKTIESGMAVELELCEEQINIFAGKHRDDQKIIGELDKLQFTETNVAEKREQLRKQLANLEDREKNLTRSQQTRLYDVRVINPALPGVKIAPVLLQAMVIAAVFGLVAGGGLAYLAEFTDKSFRSPEEIRRRLGIAVVGHIPSLPSGIVAGAIAGPIDPRIVVHHRPKSTESEAYRGVRTALYFSTQGKGHQVIQVTSPNPGDGKSTLSANLAVAIAQSGKRVVLIDCDFRKPRVHKIFGVSPEVGLASVITGDATLTQATQPSGIPNLFLLPCGPRPTNPAELLTSSRFVEVLDEIKKGYDFVLIDTPPLLAVSDPAVVAPRVDGVLMTIRITSRTRPAAERARETLAALGVNVVGVVVNDLQGSKRGGNYGYGYGYGYGYTYGYGYRYTYNYAYGYAENYGETNDDSGELPALNQPGSNGRHPVVRRLT
ncbi:MAG TPA: polysaccharide biosynthesis tyrosine autokinase [Gemmataceae bacterium]|nr:polysaccharide biosynthesis tyrosine autokinase [Gemmataceae bacterium]